MGKRQTVMWNITYLTPRGNTKWVLWRGKDEGNATRSFLNVMPSGTEVERVYPYTLKWIE